MQDAYTFSTRARDYRSQKIAEIYYEYEKQLPLQFAVIPIDTPPIAKRHGEGAFPPIEVEMENISPSAHCDLLFFTYSTTFSSTHKA